MKARILLSLSIATLLPFAACVADTDEAVGDGDPTAQVDDPGVEAPGVGEAAAIAAPVGAESPAAADAPAAAGVPSLTAPSGQAAAVIGSQCDSFIFGSDPCVQWTGRWPTGSVRALAGLDHLIRKLQTCGGSSTRACTNFVDVAGSSSRGVTSGWFKASKNGWYRTCVTDGLGKRWTCMRISTVVYLGD
jgi:hypothetical protein